MTLLLACRFGTATLLLNFIPIVGLVFSFTNTVGAAMWAAQLEAEVNLIDAPEPATDIPKVAEPAGSPAEGASETEENAKMK